MNVLVYVFDSLRPDHLSCYGHDRPTSPAVDAVAEDGVRFTNAFAQGIWTAPTSGSIVTGLYPSVHGGETVSQPLSPDAPRIAETLSRAGLTTGAVSSIDQVSCFRGFDRGFEEFVELFRDRGPEDPALTAALHDRIDRWLDDRGDEDWFLFAWSLGTHTPYLFPEVGPDADAGDSLPSVVPGDHPAFVDPDYDGPVDGTISSLKAAGREEVDRVRSLYDSAIRYNDALLGALIERLKRAGVYEETMVVLTADHGEVLDEHGRLEQSPAVARRLGRLPGLRRVADRFELFEPSGFVGHSALLPYDELIRVPLVVKFPDGEHAGTVVDDVVESVDVFPTVARAVADRTDGEVGGDPIPEAVQGAPLQPLVRGERREKPSLAYSESRTLKGSNRYRSVRDREHKYVEVAFSRPSVEDLRLQPHRAAYSVLEYALNDRRLLFEVGDLGGDSDERRNRASEAPARRSELAERLAAWRQANDAIDLAELDRATLEESTIDRLEQLGYVDT